MAMGASSYMLARSNKVLGSRDLGCSGVNNCSFYSNMVSPFPLFLFSSTSSPPFILCSLSMFSYSYCNNITTLYHTISNTNCAHLVHVGNRVHDRTGRIVMLIQYLLSWEPSPSRETTTSVLYML